MSREPARPHPYWVGGGAGSRLTAHGSLQLPIPPLSRGLVQGNRRLIAQHGEVDLPRDVMHAFEIRSLVTQYVEHQIDNRRIEVGGAHYPIHHHNRWHGYVHARVGPCRNFTDFIVGSLRHEIRHRRRRDR